MTVRDFPDTDFLGRPTLLRSDLNVTIEENGQVGNSHRLFESLETIRALQAAGARLVIGTHVGRPSGAIDARLSTGPIAKRLSEELGAPVQTVVGCVGPDVEVAVEGLAAGEVLLLENLRFHAGEESNERNFARQLARLGNIYVNDAFGTIHRAHASIVGVPTFLPAVPGLLLRREIERLSYVLDHPLPPLGLVLGGAKVDDKLPLLERLLPLATVVCIGGGMANAIQRYRAGLSTKHTQPDDRESGPLPRVCAMLADAEQRGAIRLLLPSDLVASRASGKPNAVTFADAASVPAGWHVRDVGCRTVREFRDALSACQTILWNGPLGMFEDPLFAKGSIGMARELSALDARVIAGGGNTADVIRLACVEDGFWHVSTGGGATLAMLSGKDLPGLQALKSWDPGLAEPTVRVPPTVSRSSMGPTHSPHRPRA